MRQTTERHEQLLEEYVELVNEGSLLSLESLLSEIAAYSAKLKEHPDRVAAEADVQAFAEKFDLWPEDEAWGHAVNSMTAFVHKSSKDRSSLALGGKVYFILWFIDDTMGNEFVHSMSDDHKQAAQEFSSAVSLFLQTGTVENLSHSPLNHLFLAIVEVWHEIQHQSDPKWLKLFKVALAQHLQEGSEEQDSRDSGKKYTVESYFDSRYLSSGTWVTVRMIELTQQSYIDRQLLQKLDVHDGTPLHTTLVELEELSVAIGSGLNDLFSFEKEFLDAGSDYNVVSVIYQNNHDLTLIDAFGKAADLINNLWKAFTYGVGEFTESIQTDERLDDEQKQQLLNYTDGLTDLVKAAWVWQAYITLRYKRLLTMIKENQVEAFN